MPCDNSHLVSAHIIHVCLILELWQLKIEVLSILHSLELLNSHKFYSKGSSPPYRTDYFT